MTCEQLLNTGFFRHVLDILAADNSDNPVPLIHNGKVLVARLLGQLFKIGYNAVDLQRTDSDF
ncbi:hypothetical protein D3C85_1696860 [compost metagenome]